MSEPPVGGTGQPPGDEPPPPPSPPGPPTPPGPPPGGDAGWGSAPPPPPPGGFATGPEGYSIGNAFRYGWEKFQANLGPLVLIALLVLVGLVLINLVAAPFRPTAELDPETGRIEGGGMFGAGMIVTWLFVGLTIVVQLVVQSGIIKGALGLTRGQPLTFGTAFPGINWGNVVITSLITGVATAIGAILCILPGIVVWFLTSYALYFVIDRNMGAVDAIKASVHLTTHNLGSLVLFFLAALVVQIIGACLCGVGLLVAMPVAVIAQAYTFRTLTGDPVTT